jgi:rSAM/selenodomain-associated transferase 1
VSRAFASHFADGARSVVLIGTDCPDISLNHLRAAFRYLENHDLVLGPAFDGGYYLIGLSANRPELFEGIGWGESSVLEKTITTAESAGLRTALLDPLRDIDRPEDLHHCIRIGLLEEKL